MDHKDMTFEEIKANKETFLQSYGVKESFLACGISWDTLMDIGEDYEVKCFGDGRATGEYKGEYFQIIQRHITKIASFEDVHSYRFRIKKTGSLLAKVIRKANEHKKQITADNYFHEITDLLGVRILYVFKEDYWPVNEQIMEEYGNQIAQDICVKLKKGDKKDIYDRLCTKYSNVKLEEDEVYRSIHYTIYASKANIDACPRIEIQTRTIFEEGWSEINHRLVYKKGVTNQGLSETSNVLSSMVGACDSIGALMKLLYDNGIYFDTNGSEEQNAASTANDPVGEVIRKFLLS